MGVERTWEYLKNEFDREGDGLSDPMVKYFETVGPGPQLFAVIVNAGVYTRRLIVVVGADGRQGSSIIEALLEYPNEWRVRGITTDFRSFHSQEFVRRGVDMIECNINSREECRKAFADAYGIFVITNFWLATNNDERQQAVNLVEAAREANIQHLIANGLLNPMGFHDNQNDFPFYPISKTHIQSYMREISYSQIFPHTTYIHGGFYYQNFIPFIVPDVKQREFRYPILSNIPIPFYDVRDTGYIVRECFRHPEKWGNSQIIPMIAERLTMEQICVIIRETILNEIRFVSLPYDEALLRLPAELVKNLKWYQDFDTVDQHHVEKTKMLCPKMKTFADWLRENQWLLE